MPLYRCSIRGEDFPGLLLGESEPVGFYATRFVEAPTADEAELRALRSLRGEDIFNLPAEARTGDARIFFEEVVELDAGAERGPDSGFAFFLMGS